MVYQFCVVVLIGLLLSIVQGEQLFARNICTDKGSVAVSFVFTAMIYSYVRSPSETL